MSTVAVVLVIAALLAGLALGWWLAGRGRAGVEAEVLDLRDKFARAVGELATMSERAARADDLADRLSTSERAREEAATALASLTAAGESDRRAHERELAALKGAREELKAQFSEVGGQLLKDTQEAFLKRADDRFRQSETASGEALKGLMQPVHDRLATYEEAVRKVEADRQAAYGDLKGVIGEVRVGQERVQAEAARLVNSLRNAPKARGRWGEQQLRNVLESCGLTEHVDFHTEVSVDTDDGRLRPDATVRVPGGQTLIIDAKVSLNAYQDAYNADDEDGRRRMMAAHAGAMKAHVTTLGAKAYQNQFDSAPDYVVMFVPGEHFLSAALEHDPGLWDYAFEKNVLLATPTNLVAIARTVAGVWRQEKVAAEATQIAALGKELFERIGVAAEHLKTVGGHLGKAVGSYNKLTTSFDTRLMTTGRRFEQLNVDTGGRKLPDLEAIELLPSYSEAAE